MDSGLTVRPVGVAAQAATVRPDAAPVRDAVPTNLAPPQTVTASSKPNATRQDPVQTGTSDPSYVRKIILDAHSREVIYQVLDVGSGRVVRQIPEEATLRLKAYVRALANGATPNQAYAQADLDVEA
jgi:flagellar protein FlaG